VECEAYSSGVSRKENIFFLCELCALSEAGGEKIPHWDFESLPLATALVYNLILPGYVKILCGSLNCLTKAFAQLDIEKRQNKLAGKQSVNAGSNDAVPLITTASLHTEDRRIIRFDERYLYRQLSNFCITLRTYDYPVREIIKNQNGTCKCF
jgi:hypothetical protein